MTTLQGKLLALALKFAVSYLRKHPELLDEVSKHIPGKVDDLALKVLAKLLGSDGPPRLRERLAATVGRTGHAPVVGNPWGTWRFDAVPQGLAARGHARLRSGLPRLHRAAVQR